MLESAVDGFGGAVAGAGPLRLSAARGIVERDNGNAAGCADHPDSDGSTAFLPSLLLTGGVPDHQWAEAVRLLDQVAGAAGFGPAEVVVGRPGQDHVVPSGVRESRTSFGSTENATLRLEAGCHLPERDHA